MKPIINLHILAEKFTQLSNAAYFDPDFCEFSAKTAAATTHAIENEAAYPTHVIRTLEQQLWRVLKFISGSRSNDAPHEVQYVLRQALHEWGDRDALISSASLNELNFFLDPVHLWDFIRKTLTRFDTEGYNRPVVRIASPEAYKNKPIFCIPLFHELGHYVDQKLGVSEASLLISPIPAPPAGMNIAVWKHLNLCHRMEYFADLFASCYCGATTNKSLQAIAPDNQASQTHPATADRVQVVNDFLNGINNDRVNLIQATLAQLNQPILSLRYKIPDIQKSFDDVLTYNISSKEELYGTFIAAWEYLDDQILHKNAPWVTPDLTASHIEKIVNDLTEKSIRNFEIKERWENVATN